MGAKKVKKMSIAAIARRVRKMTNLRAKYIADGVEKIHVKVMPGNTKTGEDCWTVSGIPIADCPHKCAEIKQRTDKGTVERGNGGCGFTGCYDIQNVCFQPTVQNSRAVNSAIRMKDRRRYWAEIEAQVVANGIHELRVNVGGDVDFIDMCHINAMAARHPECDILFFTKDDDGLNTFLDAKGDFEPNVHYLLSVWPGMECKNSHNVPESHLIWEDGTTTLPEYAERVSYCGGNCSECHKGTSGCWHMKRSDTLEGKQYQILFAH